MWYLEKNREFDLHKQLCLGEFEVVGKLCYNCRCNSTEIFRGNFFLFIRV